MATKYDNVTIIAPADTGFRESAQFANSGLVWILAVRIDALVQPMYDAVT